MTCSSQATKGNSPPSQQIPGAIPGLLSGQRVGRCLYLGNQGDLALAHNSYHPSNQQISPQPIRLEENLWVTYLSPIVSCYFPAAATLEPLLLKAEGVQFHNAAREYPVDSPQLGSTS